MARVRSVGGTRVTPLSDGWELAAAPAGSVSNPQGLANARLDWSPARAPNTVASALRATGRWSLDDRVDFDVHDWWWRHRFVSASGAAATARVLRFAGLATLAEVWIGAQSILQSDNMFTQHEVNVGASLGTDSELTICFRSLASALKARRPRPRWRTRIVEAQQLRWFRTALSGRIPAWSPAAAPVGPWRPIVLEERADISVVRADVRPRVEGSDGVVDIDVELEAVAKGAITGATIRVAGQSAALKCAPNASGRVTAQGTLRIQGVERWWPHTHGTPARHPVELSIALRDREVLVDLGAAAFRAIELDQGGDRFELRFNGVPVFCRGACWTPLDPAALIGSPSAYRTTLEAARAAGMNMVRVCGPFFYEDDAFYDACDELGILVWQDYSFANMDYPADDPAFVASVEREARDFLDRTQLAGSIAVLCGNSEVEQQAAMIGAPREIWRSPLFSRTLLEASSKLRPDVPYWPSTPTGPCLPFAIDVGTAHYFGVGAYLRPLEDARRASVRFATECLAFANVPEPASIDELLKNGGTPPQDPRWKARTPRDGAAGWDFDDVRDHYLRVLFGVDPVALRYADVSRYLALSRVVTGEVMGAVFAEWRRTRSRCSGGLLWFLRDLWQGAGWGVLEADGRPKAAYHYLRRVLQPVTVLLLDEGLNGLDVHVVNDGAQPVEAEVRVVFLRDGEVPVARANTPVRVGPHGSARTRIAGLLEHFLDTTYAYRFGPPAYDVAVAQLVEPTTGATRAMAYHFPSGPFARQEPEVGLEAAAARVDDGVWRLTLRARRFAQSVWLEIPGFTPDDNYFHVAPGIGHDVILRADANVAVPKGTAQPLNSRAATKVVVLADPALAPDGR